MVTIYELMLELSTQANPSDNMFLKAKASTINDDNDEMFAQMVTGWRDGIYDEDPDLLLDDLYNILKV